MRQANKRTDMRASLSADGPLNQFPGSGDRQAAPAGIAGGTPVCEAAVVPCPVAGTQALHKIQICC